MTPRQLPTPAWVTVIIIIAALPVMAIPTLLGLLGPDRPEARTLLYLYPLYVVVAAWLAYKSYPTRSYISWILVGLMILSHLAMWILVDPGLLQK